MIAAVGMDNIIGIDGDIPWYLPEDFKHFKKTTEGCTVIMGSGTWKSLPRKPLPNRRNIVISSKTRDGAVGEEWVSSIKEAFESALDWQDETKDVFVIGGGSVYEQCMPYAEELIISHVHNDFDVPADAPIARFPTIDERAWEKVSTEAHEGFDVCVYRAVATSAERINLMLGLGFD